MFKKSAVVGVSITPDAGLEIAQIDYASGMIMKYGRKSVDYNVVRREIADIDLFKDSLQDLLEEMAIPKGTELVLNMPPSVFKVADYPASMDSLQIENVIEEELYDNPYLQNYEPAYAYKIVNSSLQSNKIAYTALQKSTIIELILAIKEMGYKIKTVDVSLNSILNSLIYLDRVNTEPDVNWILLTIDSGCCRIVSMMGRNYLDTIEEKISIGEVLSDAENYATVIAAVEPLLKNLPAKYLCIVSTTNIISAEIIANKIQYSAPIIYQEANCYLKEMLLKIAPTMNEDYTKMISLDVIGAAIYPDFAKTNLINFNLFNKSLGDIYLSEQPPSFMNGKIILTNELLILIFIVIAVVVVSVAVFMYGWLSMQIHSMQSEIDEMNNNINKIKAFLAANKDVSSNTFDEGDEVRIGLAHNKNIYSYYTIVGTEIPKKLWLTYLRLGDKTTIEGQADNLESVYAFFRSIKDYNPDSDISLQKLGLAKLGIPELVDESDDGQPVKTEKEEKKKKDTVLTSLDADFYEFRISNDTEDKKKPAKTDKSGNSGELPAELEIIN